MARLTWAGEIGCLRKRDYVNAQWPTWGTNSADGIPASFMPLPSNPCPSHSGVPNSPIAKHHDLVLLHVLRGMFWRGRNCLSPRQNLDGSSLPFLNLSVCHSKVGRIKLPCRVKMRIN